MGQLNLQQTVIAISTIKQNIQTFKRQQKEMREDADALDAVIAYAKESLVTLEGKPEKKDEDN